MNHSRTSLLLFGLLTLISVETNAQTPSFLTEIDINAFLLAEATNHYISLGEKATIEEFKKLAEQDFFSNDVDTTFRIACLCRILWANDEEPISPPKLGMYGQGVRNHQKSDNSSTAWPLYPLAKSGSTYFVVVHGGRGGGRTVPISTYIEQCQQGGTFRQQEIAVPTNQRAVDDAEALRNSTRWDTEFSTENDTNTWNFIERQTETTRGSEDPDQTPSP